MNSEEMYIEITSFVDGNFDSMTTAEQTQFVFSMEEYFNQKRAEIEV